MSLFEVKAEIPVVAVEETDALLLEIGELRWSVVEDIILKRAWLVGYFDSAEQAAQKWAEVKPLLPVCPVGDTIPTVLLDRDWRDSYKAHFKAWRFGRLRWIPVWEREQTKLAAGEEVIWLDPGLAFGTGNHETTRLCVERLVTLSEGGVERRTVIDAGCGSGILALSAVRLGYSKVEAFDNDPEAVRASIENAQLNGLSGRVKFETADLGSGLAGRSTNLLLANLQADVLMKFSQELVGAVAPGGTLVLSGILAVENKQVRSVFEQTVPTWSVDSREMGEWSDLMLMHPC